MWENLYMNQRCFGLILPRAERSGNDRHSMNLMPNIEQERSGFGYILETYLKDQALDMQQLCGPLGGEMKGDKYPSKRRGKLNLSANPISVSYSCHASRFRTRGAQKIFFSRTL